MPKSGGSESASSTSEKELDVDESALPADISVIFNNDFVCEGSRELTEEQRNDIKYIVCGFDWTEITQEEFGNIDEADSIYWFEAVDGAYIYTLTLYDNDRAFFVRNTPEDQSEDSGAEVNGIYFRVKSAEIVEKMTEYFSSGDETEVPDGEAVPPLAGIAEREYKSALESGCLVINDCICDAFLQNALLKPKAYSVIATMNLNGDYVSDMLAAQVGGIGIAPGGNINYQTGHAIFEATHGIAPDIAGKDIVNPSSIILSAVIMLDYLGWNEAGKRIEDALERLFQQGIATADLARFMPNGKSVGTKEFGNQLIATL